MCTGYPIWNANYSKPHWFLGLPFLIAHFGIHGFHQFRTFQKMVCNNQEPKKKGGKSLVTKNIVKQTWPYQPDRRILHIKALLFSEFLTSCNLKMFSEVHILFSISS